MGVREAERSPVVERVGFVTMRKTMATTSTASTIPTTVPRAESERNVAEDDPSASRTRICARRVGE